MPQQSTSPPLKRIGVLTSGGDCSGLNAVIRAVVFRATQTYGCKVFGIQRGSLGLMERPLMYEELDLNQFKGHMLRTGGTMLGTTSKGDPFHFPMPDGSFKERSDEFVEGYQELGLDALIGIGGDGGLNLLSKLTSKGGIGFVGIPKTIDNDVALTEFAVGFSTAVTIATDALDRLLSTAVSHSRVMILEVMGRDAGHIAISAGLAGGADVILLPEIAYSEDGIVEKLKSLEARGQQHALMVVAEGVESVGTNGPLGDGNSPHRTASATIWARSSAAGWTLTCVSPFWATYSEEAHRAPRTVFLPRPSEPAPWT